MPALFTPNFQRSDSNGNPLSGAKLYFYQSTTTTPITVYQDAALATPHSVPVVADASGAFAEIFVNTDPYKFVLTNSAGTPIETVDAIPLANNPKSTTTEVLTGTSTTAAVTPDALAALWEKGADVASAGTVSLGEGSLFHITGTSTITDIDFATAKDGRRATLIFDAALTLTHNATTLKLPGAANISTAAGDRCVVVQDSSDNVIVESYTRADGTGVIPGSMTLLGTLATTSGATQSLTGIAAGYRQLYIEVESVSGTSTDQMTLALSSTNGSAYGTAVNLLDGTAAASDVLGGAITVFNISSAIAAAKVADTGILRNGAVTGITNDTLATPTDTAAVVNAIRFAWSSAGNFDAGTIRIYGVK